MLVVCVVLHFVQGFSRCDFWLGSLVVDCCVRFSVLVLFVFVGLYGCCVSCFACCCLGSLVSFWFGDLCAALLLVCLPGFVSSAVD